MSNTAIQKLDITNFFDEKIFDLLEEGFAISHKLGLIEFSDLALLHLLLKDTKILVILGREKVKDRELAQKVYQELQKTIPEVKYSGVLFMSLDVQRILLVAFKEVMRQRKRKLGVEDLLLAFSQNPKFLKMFNAFDLDVVRVEQKVEEEGGILSQKLERKTPLLDSYSKDLTDIANRGGFEQVVGRDTEQLQITRILARQEKNNVLLVGERGVGKRTIIQGMAISIASGKVPTALRGIRILELDLHALRSVATSRERLEAIMDQMRMELRNNPNVLLFIEDLDNLFKFEESRELFELGTIIKPLLIKGEMRVVATIDSESYRKYVEADASLSKAFAIIRVDEPNEEIAVEMARNAAIRLAKYHNVEIGGDAIKSSVYLSKRYLPEKRLPEKAVDLLDEACSKISIEGKNLVSDEDINVIISEKTGIPLQKITESEQVKLVNLEKILSEKVVGQERAVTMAVSYTHLRAHET